MKITALNETHKKLGAKMVPYAGYEMPVQYAGVNHEHMAVRERLGVFDVSHMGEIFVRGPKAEEFLQHVCSNDITKVAVGQAQYNCLPNEQGGIVDDLIAYKLGDEEWMLVVNASNMEKDWDWLNKHNHAGADLKNESDEYSLLAIQGPKAVEAMQPLSPVNLSEIPFYHFKTGEFAGVKDVIISATGYTGEGGFEIYFKNKDAQTIWEQVMKAGEEFGIEPCGLAARDTLRLEKGYCLYGNDINEEISPLEAGLGWITKLNTDFIGRDAMSKLKEEGVSKKLVGFKMKERGIPRQGYVIANEKGEIVGEVTSGTMSPVLKEGIGLGFVTPDLTAAGTPVFIRIRDKDVAAEVVKLPFV